MRTVGTQAIGIRTPIISRGDNLPEVVVEALLEHGRESGVPLCNRDIIGVTEAVLARAQGNYATTAHIAAAVREKFPRGTVGLIFPILSRNRFSVLLKGIAMGVDKLIIQLSYPADEVGNHIVAAERLYEAGIDPYQDVFTEKSFRASFPDLAHAFTAIDYLALYRTLGEGAEIILANNPAEMLRHTKQVIAADIHTRDLTRRRLLDAGAQKVCDLSDFLNTPTEAHGYNEAYGLLGSNKAGEDRVKLFPHSCETFVETVQRLIFQRTGASVEVLIYGDGAFKDPVGKIWELADPVVSPAFTDGLRGLPNELKLKYIADNEFSDKRGEAAREAIVRRIAEKGQNLMGKDETGGTTPRKLSDLVGSLCDLISGSGDKGTPVVLIKGYFDNYASE